ncbi:MULTISPECIES: hypothetical protein [Paenibacillus]|uniref:hypothetical protein n=1 Tax=Paenibacillus sp. ALJ109b TaxID=2709068 RepID=UPI001968826E|nr:hypothetical protein [Paenibacillus sp. ALJ109b]
MAKEALYQYPNIWEKLVYLGKSDNVTFQVQTSDDNQKFLIKIHISTISIQSKGYIASELIWLEALVKDTNLGSTVSVRYRIVHQRKKRPCFGNRTKGTGMENFKKPQSNRVTL